MIIICHNNKKVLTVKSSLKNEIDFNSNLSIAHVLKELASKYSSELIFWHEESKADIVDLNAIPELFHHNKMMMSYNPSQNNFLNEAIGFADLSIFIKVNKEVRYPTWQMSALAGGVHASVINALTSEIKLDSNFEYFLNSMAKLAMPQGLFCYSEPRLLNKKVTIKKRDSSLFTVFKFVKQHYKISWIFILLLNLLIYKRQLAIIPFLNSLFYAKRKLKATVLDEISVTSLVKKNVNETIDVIIPTIGRKKYLYDVLKDLSNQTVLPRNVIIVEQNPNENSVSDLNYIIDEDWPFKIKHTFTHQTGACNARNIALEQIISDWVFLADDDIRFENSFLKECLFNVEKYNQQAITLACLRLNDEKKNGEPIQWGAFGSGCSFVKANVLKELNFNMQYEFGFGEDAEFGMQLRNNGTDVVYCYSPTLLHLKAPIGGFRTKHIHPWDVEKIKPKPSPTVMLFETANKTQTQVFGYKTLLFIKYYRLQNINSPFSYFRMFQKQWTISNQWSNYLKEGHQHEV